MILLFLEEDPHLEMWFNRLGKTISESLFFFLFMVSVHVSKSCFVRSTYFRLKGTHVLNQTVFSLVSHSSKWKKPPKNNWFPLCPVFAGGFGLADEPRVKSHLYRLYPARCESPSTAFGQLELCAAFPMER